MTLSASTDIQASPSRVWSVVSDIEKAGEVISAIDDLKVLEHPTGPSLVGLTWQETRTMFGKAATEVMWITDASHESFYETRAESHGAVYVSRIELEPRDGGTRLRMGFEATPVTASAKLMWLLTGWMAKRALRNTLSADLADIKAAAER